MNEVRVTVEWLFGEIKTYFKFVDFKTQLKVGLRSVGKIYLVCGLLQNARTCLYGNKVSEYFEMDPMTLEEYFQYGRSKKTVIKNQYFKKCLLTTI